MPEENKPTMQNPDFMALLHDFFENKNLKDDLWYMFNLAVSSDEFIKLEAMERSNMTLQFQMLIQNLEKLEKIKDAV